MPALKLVPMCGYLVAERVPRRAKYISFEDADTVVDDDSFHEEERRAEVKTGQVPVTRSADSVRTTRAVSGGSHESRLLAARILSDAIDELRSEEAYSIRACARRARVNEKTLRLILRGERPCPVDLVMRLGRRVWDIWTMNMSSVEV